jgi:hypothetical protein
VRCFVGLTLSPPAVHLSLDFSLPLLPGLQPPHRPAVSVRSCIVMLRGTQYTRIQGYKEHKRVCVYIFTLHTRHALLVCFRSLCPRSYDRVQQLSLLRTASRSGRCWGDVSVWPLAISHEPCKPLLMSQRPAASSHLHLSANYQIQSSEYRSKLPLLARPAGVDQQCPCTTLQLLWGA